MKATTKITNSLLAGAIGDALGAPVEFGDGGTKEAILSQANGFAGDGKVTDDTQMMLFTLEACLEWRREPDPGQPLIDHLWQAYRRWYTTQTMDPDRFFKEVGGARGLQMIKSLWVRRAPGATCLGALGEDRAGELPGEPLNNSKGCGGVMRVAPIAFCTEDPFLEGCRAAALTHGHRDGWLPAGALCVMLERLVMGDHLDSAAVSAWHRVQSHVGDQSNTGDLITKALVMFNEGDRDVTKLGAGWTGDEALAIGLLAALHGLREGVMEGYAMAIAHPGDSDSTGLIAGTLMGAAGEELPEPLLAGVEHGALIAGLGKELVAALWRGDES